MSFIKLWGIQTKSERKKQKEICEQNRKSIQVMSSIEQKYAKRWMTAQKNKQKIDNFNYQKHLLIHHHCQEVIENRADANAWKKKKIERKLTVSFKNYLFYISIRKSLWTNVSRNASDIEQKAEVIKRG